MERIGWRRSQRRQRGQGWRLAPRSWRLAAAVALLMSGLTGAHPAPAAAAFEPTTVQRADFRGALGHNIPNLVVREGTRQLNAFFLDTYTRTGGLTRWGEPTSEVLEEEPGHLTQYYQRGVLDWHFSPTCPPGERCFERRLAWDYFGGDRSPRDLGVEPTVAPAGDPASVGFWRHRVVDQLADGTPIGFRRFFTALGGEAAFGFPKTEARPDTNRPGTLFIPEATPGFIRQYFQSAVMEYHPGDPEPVKLRLLGDDLRSTRNYPDGAWKVFRSFRPAAPLAANAPYEVERVLGGARQRQGLITGVNSVTERCPTTPWLVGANQPLIPFCTGSAPFQAVPLEMDLLTGDVIRTRPASPDVVYHVVFDVLGRAVAGSPVVQAIVTASTNAQLQLLALLSGMPTVILQEGDIGVNAETGAPFELATEGGTGDVGGTIFLASVRRDGGTTTTTIKVIEGQMTLRGAGRTTRVTISANQPGAQQGVLQPGRDPTAQPLTPLTADETARVALLRQLQSRLGRPLQAPPPVLRVLPEAITFASSTAPPPQTITIGNAGGSTLTWQATANVPWLLLSQSSGSAARQTDGTLQVTLDRNRPSGRLTGQITIASNGGQIVVPVDYTPPPPVP